MSLNTVVFEGDPSKITTGIDAFKGISTDVKVYLPKGTTLPVGTTLIVKPENI